MAAINITAGQNLQAAINAAAPGDVITVESGATFELNLDIAKQDLEIVSSNPEKKFNVVSPNVMWAVYFSNSARNIKITDLHATHSNDFSYSVITMSSDQVKTAGELPKEIHFNRLLIDSRDDQNTKRGIEVAAEGFSLKNSQILGCKGQGQDSQAIFARHGGNYLIEDCKLEGAGENVMFGGADTLIRDHNPHDIVMRRCHLFKPIAWKGTFNPNTGGWDNQKWSVKNLFEIKAAERILVEDCVLENNWANAQIGWALMFTPRNQDGGMPWAVMRDVTFRNNKIINSDRGINLMGADYLQPSRRSENVFILNNEWIDIKDHTMMLNSGGHVNGETGGKNFQIKHNTFRNLTRLGSIVMDNVPEIDRLQVFVENNVWRSSGEYGMYVDSFGTSREAFYKAMSQDSTWKDNVIGIDPASSSWSLDYGQRMFAYDTVVPVADVFDASGKVNSKFIGNDGKLVGADLSTTTPTPTPTPVPVPTPAPVPVDAPAMRVSQVRTEIKKTIYTGKTSNVTGIKLVDGKAVFTTTK